jgi:hypothetical protein
VERLLAVKRFSTGPEVEAKDKRVYHDLVSIGLLFEYYGLVLLPATEVKAAGNSEHNLCN